MLTDMCSSSLSFKESATCLEGAGRKDRERECVCVCVVKMVIGHAVSGPT